MSLSIHESEQRVTVRPDRTMSYWGWSLSDTSYNMDGHFFSSRYGRDECIRQVGVILTKHYGATAVEGGETQEAAAFAAFAAWGDVEEHRTAGGEYLRELLAALGDESEDVVAEIEETFEDFDLSMPAPTEEVL